MCIGAKPFTEQYILAALIEQTLNGNGLSASRRESLGSSIIFNALAAGEIGAYVDYSGTVWTNFMKRSDVQPRQEMLAEITVWCASTRYRCSESLDLKTPMRLP